MPKQEKVNLNLSCVSRPLWTAYLSFIAARDCDVNNISAVCLVVVTNSHPPWRLYDMKRTHKPKAMTSYSIMEVILLFHGRLSAKWESGGLTTAQIPLASSFYYLCVTDSLSIKRLHTTFFHILIPAVHYAHELHNVSLFKHAVVVLLGIDAAGKMQRIRNPAGFRIQVSFADCVAG